MTTERDGVLAVLDHCAPRAATMEQRRLLAEARAAVAELIEADKEYDEASRYYYDPSVKDVELVSAGERLRMATERRTAALARVSGGA